MSAPGYEALKKQRKVVRERVISRLDRFLIGTVARSPAMKRYGLTTKVEGEDEDSLCQDGYREAGFGDVGPL